MKPYDDGREKREQVRDMFDHIAPRYDRLNGVLSFNVDKHWRRRAIREVVRFMHGYTAETASAAEVDDTASTKVGAGEAVSNYQTHNHVLDLATGTGDMAIALARALPKAAVTGADLSEGMLALARQKAAKAGLAERIAFEAGEAESLPFGDAGFDAVTVAFGVRNFHDIAAGLREMHRVLRPGGMALVLEFSTPRGKIFGPLYRFYFRHVLPRIGGWVSRDRSAYEYLPGSVDGFPEPQAFAGMMSDAGFGDCRMRKMTGGIAYIYTAKKEF